MSMKSAGSSGESSIPDLLVIGRQCRICINRNLQGRAEVEEIAAKLISVLTVHHQGLFDVLAFLDYFL